QGPGREGGVGRPPAAGAPPSGKRPRPPPRAGGPRSQREVRPGDHRLRRIEVRGLSKRFGARTAVEGLDFEVGEGEVFGLLGPNGAGETTTVRVPPRRLRPSS